MGDAESVDGYQILRRRPSEGERRLLVLVASTGSTDTVYVDDTANEDGMDYIFWVKAVRDGEISKRTNYVRVTGQADTVVSEPDPTEPLPGPPLGFSAVAGARGVVLRGIHDAAGTKIPGTSAAGGGHYYNAGLTFTPSETGTYYVAASAFRNKGLANYVGTYTLSVKIVGDDIGADIAGAATVTVGGSARGRIETADDRDWFAVELEAGTEYRFDLDGRTSATLSLTDPKIYGIHDANGDLIPGTGDDESGWYHDARLLFTPSTTGTYYVAAGAGDLLWMAWASLGAYKLTVTVFTDLAAGTGTVGEVAVGATIDGELEFGGDRDWFAVEFEAGTTYWIDLFGEDTRPYTTYDTYLYGVYDSDGTLIPGTKNDDVYGRPLEFGDSRDARVIFTPSESGTYYISAGSRFDLPGTYGLSVTVYADDFSADTATTGAVTVGGSVTGAIETGHDCDWFAVTLIPGITYRIDLEGADTDSGTLTDPYLHEARDSNGRIIFWTFDDDSGVGQNSQVTFTPNSPNGTTYYLAVGGDGILRGSYTLTVQIEGTVNYQPSDFTNSAHCGAAGFTWSEETGTCN